MSTAALVFVALVLVGGVGGEALFRWATREHPMRRAAGQERNKE